MIGHVERLDPHLRDRLLRIDDQVILWRILDLVGAEFAHLGRLAIVVGRVDGFGPGLLLGVHIEVIEILYLKSFLRSDIHSAMRPILRVLVIVLLLPDWLVDY